METESAPDNPDAPAAGPNPASSPSSKDPDRKAFGQGASADLIFNEYLKMKYKNDRKPVHKCERFFPAMVNKSKRRVCKHRC